MIISPELNIKARYLAGRYWHAVGSGVGGAGAGTRIWPAAALLVSPPITARLDVLGQSQASLAGLRILSTFCWSYACYYRVSGF